ncbi:MAG: glycerol-3-phosphate acyltransferase, partial [Candidatus Pacebacteria bacterium]|nr:glycerol-3-phosphate acyltransferase [Candidatus Paceibacterota bacterium]
MDNLWLILTGLIAYLLGSIPTAFLVVRKAKGKAVWLEGSGNVGTMNVYRATGSLWLMALTLVADMGKAALALYVAGLITDSAFGQ